MDWSYVAGYFDGEGNVYLKKAGTRSSRGASLSWFNTHRESLEAIHEFIGAGVLKEQKMARLSTKQPYVIVVSQCEEVVRVASAMHPFSIVKRDQLPAAIEEARATTPMTKSSGNLAAMGPEWVRARYWDEGLLQEEIGALVGVSRAAVKNYMQRQGIPARDASEVHRRIEANRPPEAEAERRRKLSESRRALWQDPAYRERAVAAMRNGKPRGDNLPKVAV